MPVTEFAVLPLSHVGQQGSSLPNTLAEKLQNAKQVLEKASGYSFYYFRQVEDPSIIYIIGKWDSPAVHSVFLSSPENQKLLEILKDDVIMDKLTMWHLDVDVFSVPSPKDTWVLKAPTISCNRHFISKDKKEGFEKKFQEVKHLLEDFTKPYNVVGGWRIEKESDEKEEWTVFSGFENVDHNMSFAKTKEFEKYREIFGFVDGFEVKHMQAIEGL